LTFLFQEYNSFKDKFEKNYKKIMHHLEFSKKLLKYTELMQIKLEKTEQMFNRRFSAFSEKANVFTHNLLDDNKKTEY